MNISLALTTYNRYDLTLESCAQVLNDPRIDDIIILDDCSTDGSYEKLKEYYKEHSHVRVMRQIENRGMSINKRDAISYAKNSWVVIFDSDNIIGPDYLDAFFNYAGEVMDVIPDNERCIFCPDFAKPNFDYRAYTQGGGGSKFTYRAGIYGSAEAKIEIKRNDFNCLMNTCNYIVNRNFYLKAYEHNPEHVASDTIWHNYNHLKAGGVFWVVPGMEYEHRVHYGSGFKENIDYNMKQAEKVRKMIMAL